MKEKEEKFATFFRRVSYSFLKNGVEFKKQCLKKRQKVLKEQKEILEAQTNFWNAGEFGLERNKRKSWEMTISRNRIKKR